MADGFCRKACKSGHSASCFFAPCRLFKRLFHFPAEHGPARLRCTACFHPPALNPDAIARRHIACLIAAGSAATRRSGPAGRPASGNAQTATRAEAPAASTQAASARPASGARCGADPHPHRPRKPSLQAQRLTPAALAITRTLAAHLPPAARMGAGPASGWAASLARKNRHSQTREPAQHAQGPRARHA